MVPSGDETSPSTTPMENVSQMSGSGITHAIRNHLNFKDPKKWKEFSTRRLELIDKFHLSSKKASEQDDAIRQIADMLRIEFGFGPSALSDFDKLVRAAIQSVRRNRKRSSKARVNNDRFILVEETKPSLNNDSDSTLNNPLSSSFASPSLHKPIPSISLPPTDNNNYTPRPLQSPQPLQILQPQQLHEFHHTIHGNENRVIVNSLLSRNSTPSTSLSTSLSTSPSTQLPSFKDLTTSQSNTSAYTLTNGPSVEISTFSKQRMTNFIQKSRSCLLLSNNDTTIHEENLLNLGKSIISSSIAFVLERFFNDLPSDSVNYLSQKLNSNISLSKVVKSLGYLSSELMVLSDQQATNLLSKLIGCCVKDFGFDPVSYTLGEIFHEVILNEYPLIATQVTKISQESLYLPLMPMAPKEADSEIVKNVRLVYGSKALELKFTPLSSAPPTYLELLDNGRTAFAITSDKNIRLRHLGQEVADIDLEKLFKRIDTEPIEIEFYEIKKIPSGVDRIFPSVI